MLLIQGALMMILPIAILMAIRQRRDMSVAAAAVGAGVYVLAQIPRYIILKYVGADGGLLWPILLGAIMVAFWEELGKFLPLRYLNFADWEMVTDFAVGFGGIEALLAGFRVLSVGLVLRLAPQLIDEATRTQLAATTTTLMVVGLTVAVVERAAYMGAQLGLAYLSAQTVRYRRWHLLVAAMIIHVVLDMLTGLAGLWRSNMLTSGAIELAVALIGLGLLWYAQRTQEAGPLHSDGE